MMKLIAGVIVLLVIVAGGWYFLKGSPETATPTNIENPGTENQEVTNTMPAIENVVVAYTDTGFSPATITLGAGSTVTWKNESKVKMWVASAMHPSHTTYNGSSLSEHCTAGAPKSTDIFDQCTGIEPGGSWSFTFTKVGDWKYHDHITSGRYGSITVTEVLPEMNVDDAAR